MTKSFDSAISQSVSWTTKQKLFDLMETDGMSLIKASQLLKIPYKIAKQILFTYGSNNTIVKTMALSARLSPIKKFPPNQASLSPVTAATTSKEEVVDKVVPKRT